jgi:hypothetical protein
MNQMRMSCRQDLVSARRFRALRIWSCQYLELESLWLLLDIPRCPASRPLTMKLMLRDKDFVSQSSYQERLDILIPMNRYWQRYHELNNN